jgi:hypothetical protein
MIKVILGEKDAGADPTMLRGERGKAVMITRSCSSTRPLSEE